jgi:hypothetical protein
MKPFIRPRSIDILIFLGGRVVHHDDKKKEKRMTDCDAELF